MIDPLVSHFDPSDEYGTLLSFDARGADFSGYIVFSPRAHDEPTCVTNGRELHNPRVTLLIACPFVLEVFLTAARNGRLLVALI
jgi:hypothetical protein